MAYEALRHWIDRLQDGDEVITIDQFVDDAEDTDLCDQVEHLEHQLFALPATPDEQWSGQALYRCLTAVRKQIYQRNLHSHLQSQQALPPLNPSADEPVSAL
jgi:hypothetical protein